MFIVAKSRVNNISLLTKFTNQKGLQTNIKRTCN